MTHSKAEDLASWLLQASRAVQYGSVNVELKIVAGEVRRIQKSTMESEQPEPEAVGGHNERRQRS